MSMNIRKWRLAGELRGELNRSQTQELLRALAARGGSDSLTLSRAR